MSAATKNIQQASQRRWRDVVLVALALALIVLLRKGESSYEQRDAPITQHFETSQRALARNFAVQVKGFKVAHAYLLKGDYSRPEDYVLRTPGVWLSVLAEVEALEAAGQVRARIVSRDGLIYMGTSADRPKLKGINLRDRELSAGMPERGAFFFELPPDRLQGAHLQVFWGGLVPTGGDSLVDIDLGIDAPRAQQLLGEAKPVLDLRL